MDISGMAHVIITAGDFEKSTAFYRGLLPAMGLSIIQDDEDILRGLADGLAGGSGEAPRYLGMIGSRAKRVTIFKNLAAAGVPEAFLDTVRTPMGLDIGARTHEEIAVSVVAELIQLRRGVVDPGPR